MQGLQVWDENGKKILDTSFTTVKILSKIKGINQHDLMRTVSFSHQLLATQTPFYLIKPMLISSGIGFDISVIFTKSSCEVIFQGNKQAKDFSAYSVMIGVY